MIAFKDTTGIAINDLIIFLDAPVKPNRLLGVISWSLVIDAGNMRELEIPNRAEEMTKKP